MSQMPRTSRRLPKEVYRRRRIAALIVLAVIIGLLWAGVSAISGLFSQGESNGDLNLPEGISESNVVVEAGEECPPGTVFVEAVVGNSEGKNVMSFAPEQTPHIWFTLTNTNAVDCTFNAGPKVQFFNITSGDQLIWTSKQCDRRNLEDQLIVLKAGETLPSSPLPWEKVFSSESGCGADEAPVVTGGASYHLKVEVNGELSGNTQQFILN
jgi:hypothetical protein